MAKAFRRAGCAIRKYGKQAEIEVGESPGKAFTISTGYMSMHNTLVEIAHNMCVSAERRTL